jgi:hypothetical protein
MSVREKLIHLQVFVLLCLLVFNAAQVFAAERVTLYTPFTKISVSPGEAIEYSIDVINESDEIFDGDIRVTGIPRSWTYSLKGGAYTVSRVAVLPDEKKTYRCDRSSFSSQQRGLYFSGNSGDSASLALTVNVTEMGSSDTEFTVISLTCREMPTQLLPIEQP